MQDYISYLIAAQQTLCIVPKIYSIFIKIQDACARSLRINTSPVLIIARTFSTTKNNRVTIISSLYVNRNVANVMVVIGSRSSRPFLQLSPTVDQLSPV